MISLKSNDSIGQRGQMAIFVALIFQVLFVFFAMVINVGLLVHHKINLQNSVDLAAYYGASKQAEVLSAIAHMNYQIRQSWKLLAWRYRVLGTVAAKDHPANIDENAGEEEWQRDPITCVIDDRLYTNLMSTGRPGQQSLCLRMYTRGYTVPDIGELRVIAGFLPFNQALTQHVEQLRQMNVSRCNFYGPVNWRMASWMLNGYRTDQANRKAFIYALAKKLSDSRSDFSDIEGGSVAQGMQKTFQKNLTQPNAAGVVKFLTLNSMGLGQCADPKNWLAEIRTSPTLLYADYDSSNGCAQQIKRVQDAPTSYEAYKDQIDPDGSLLTNIQGEPEGVYGSSLGVEKNPWCMPYVGARAETSPQIPFAPMGAVKLVARAYAKPFGGRIGPWYMSRWPNSSKFSSSGFRVDELNPPRRNENGALSDPQDKRRFPNYSRFVGDTLGLKSKQAQAGYGRAIIGMISANNDQPMMDFDFWLGNWYGPEEGSNDIVAWDTIKDASPTIRKLEIGSVLPDQFDITYYSIDPNYPANYYGKLNSFIGKLPGVTKFKFRPDMGYRKGRSELEGMSVKGQIDSVREGTYAWGTVFWSVLDWQNLLTGWSQISPLYYDFNRVANTGFFGRCIQPARDDIPTAGGCASGGRVGYSVKLVSRDMLISDELQIGGDGEAPGGILNKPTIAEGD